MIIGEKNKNFSSVQDRKFLILQVQDALLKLSSAIRLEILLNEGFDIPLHPRVKELFKALEPLYEWNIKHHKLLRNVVDAES